MSAPRIPVPPGGPPRLYRDSRNGLLAGVMAGVAETYRWDPAVVRIVFVVLTLATSVIPGVLLYVMATLFLPDAA